MKRDNKTKNPNKNIIPLFTRINGQTAIMSSSIEYTTDNYF